MDIETILISVFGSLGISSIVGYYFQNLWELKRETELKIQTLNEKKYNSTLAFMRCVLAPQELSQFDISDPIHELKTDAEKKEYAIKRLRGIYYDSFLYASDDVLIAIRQFIEHPYEITFENSATVMRKDLWKKETKVPLTNLSLQYRGLLVESE